MSESGSFSELVLDLAEEFVDRCRRGERPLLAEYIRRYPQLADQIRDIFPAMALVEHIAVEDDSLEREPQAAPVPELTQVGDYRIIREVGRGGMGVVYEAEQVSLGRRVAVKVLPRTVFANDRVRKRFARESRAAARLHHTNIVPVFGVGELDELQYYVMQFIQGLGLDQVLVELRRLQQVSSSANDRPIPQQIAENGSLLAQPVAEYAVTADVMALSLMSGHFQQTQLLTADPPADTSASDHVRLQSHSHGRNNGTEQNESAFNAFATADKTEVCSLSDTAQYGESGERSPSGHSPASSARNSRATYWRSVATIGVQVAEALQHAHQQGIIHRDIKPANLLMDTRGNVWVTDFGLAKAGDQQDLTHTGDILGTLRYMAPEQFEGVADHRSDTYSLGLTLYELLALQPAFPEKDRPRLIKQVTHEAPPALKTVDPSLPTDLATIVQKAIDRDPAHRYQSAEELADDLQRFLRDEPIQARRISPATRFVRWCRRNPLVSGLTSAVGVLLTVVAIGSTLAAFRFEGMAQRNASLATQKDAALTAANQARQQAEEDRQLAIFAQSQAEQARSDAEQARDTEKLLRQEAEIQRDRANTNANRARRAVDQYLSKITDNELLSVPGLQPLRQNLLAEALKFYAEFAEEQTDDPELRIELATAQYRLGVIQRELGNKPAAETANAAAIQQLEVLRDRQLGGVGLQSILAQAYALAGRYDDSVKLCQQILEYNARHLEARSTLAESYNSLAIDEQNKKNAALALSYHQQAFEIRQQLANEHPDNAKYNAELGGTINNIGVLLSEQKKTQDALTMFQLAATYDEKACQLAPYSILWARWHALSLRNAAYQYRQLGQQDEALRFFRKVVTIRDRLVFQNPAVSSLRAEHYQDLLLLANQLKQMGATVEANRAFRDAKDVLAQLAEKSQTPAELFQLAVVYASLAANVTSDSEPETTEDPEAADERQRNADLALQTLQQALNRGWADPAALRNDRALDPLRERDDFRHLARVVESIAEANKLQASQATNEARLADQQKALEILGKLVDENPTQIWHQRALATTMHSMGVVQTTLKQFAEAEQSLNQAIALREKIRKTKPDAVDFALDWLTSQSALGQLHWQREAYPKAHQIWQTCLNESKLLSEAAPHDRSLQQKIVHFERVIFNRYGQLGLTPLIVRFLESNTKQHRIFAADSDAFVTDGEFSTAMLFSHDHELARDYFSQLARAIEQSQDSSLRFDLIHFVRGASLLGDDFPIARSIADRVRRFHQEKPGEWWMAVAEAMLDYREQRYAEAATRLSAHGNGSVLQVAFQDALITWKQGDRKQAMDKWATAETAYRLQCANLLNRSPTANATGIFSEHWWQFAYGQVMRRFAAEVMAEGQPVPEDPWQHLIQARAYSLIGETLLAKQEIAAATAAAPDDLDVWLAAATLQGDSAELNARLDAAWTRSVDAAPHDPLPLIQRARWYVERGEHRKADADFAKAAELTPHELNRFLEAGWWLAGPYPPQLSEFCPPELDPDPSRPVAIINPQTGMPNQPAFWRKVGSVERGSIDFSSIAHGESSGYALAIVYSPDERTVLLRTDGYSKGMRAWVNSRPVWVSDLPESVKVGTEHVPLSLRAGRNTILVKAVYPGPIPHCSIRVRIADSPVDSGTRLARGGAWGDALETFRRAKFDQLIDLHDWSCYLLLLAASGDSEQYAQEVQKLIERYKRPAFPNWGWEVGHRLALAPNPAFNQNAAKLIEHAENHLHEEISCFLQLALMQFRAGQFHAAAMTLQKIPAGSCGGCRIMPVQALVAWHLGQPAEAREHLNAAVSDFQRQLESFGNLETQRSTAGVAFASRGWQMLESAVLLREAAQVIEGGSEPVDVVFNQLRDLGQQLWASRDARTAAFDDAVYYQPEDARVYIARGIRLAEIGAFAAAETDFSKAVELAPQNPHVLALRAACLAENGQPERAIPDFEQALTYSARSRWRDGIPIDVAASVLSERTPLFATFRTDDYFQRLAHAVRHLTQGTLQQQHWTSLEVGVEQLYAPAALALLAGDAEYFENLRNAPAPTMTPYNRTILLSLAPTSGPLTAELLENAEQMIRLERTGNPWVNRFHGLALYRGSRYEDSLTALQASLAPAADWQADGVVYPLLAMTFHQLGNHTSAAQWLAKSEQWLQWHLKIPDEEILSLRAANRMIPRDWLILAMVYHREALTLIEHPPQTEAIPD